MVLLVFVVLLRAGATSQCILQQRRRVPWAKGKGPLGEVLDAPVVVDHWPAFPQRITWWQDRGRKGRKEGGGEKESREEKGSHEIISGHPTSNCQTDKTQNITSSTIRVDAELTLVNLKTSSS